MLLFILQLVLIGKFRLDKSSLRRNNLNFLIGGLVGMSFNCSVLSWYTVRGKWVNGSHLFTISLSFYTLVIELATVSECYVCTGIRVCLVLA